MNIFFDMDYTLVAADGTLRPGVREVFDKLKAAGHDIYVWSGMGAREWQIKELGLAAMVSGTFAKPLDRFQEALRGMLQSSHVPAPPDLVIDDYPEIVAALGGIVIRPYMHPNPDDGEMERVYKIIQQYALQGHSSDDSFRLRPAGNHSQ